ncbi:MAG: efflux RND transporter periplasmic adaptor subunit [Myxococcales bacterium]|nr:efflux RND transporter periplasmic adaptor subunit [Myxococcales bacterium]
MMRARALVAVALVAGCGRKPPATEDDEPPPPVAVTCAAAETRAVTDALVVRGLVAPPPAADAVLSSLIAGRVTALAVDVGDVVVANQIVARVEDPALSAGTREAAAAIAEAEAEVAGAAAARARLEQLVSKGIGARRDLDDAIARDATARAALTGARARSSAATGQAARAVLRAPRAGTVLRVFRRSGEAVDGTPATPIVEIADVATLELRAEISAPDLVRLALGQAATVTLDALPDQPLAAVIAMVAPAIDPATGLGEVRLTLAAPPAGTRLIVGLTGTATVALGAHDGLVVPLAALRRGASGGDELVVCAGEPLAAVVTEVTVGVRQGGVAEITAGLAVGDRVVVDHALGLDDGQPLIAARRRPRPRPRAASPMIGRRWVAWLERRASLVWLVALGCAALGAAAMLTLPSGIYPEMEFPRVVVVARIGQVPPALVETSVTRPIEEAVAVVPGVRYVRARSIRGAAELSLQLVDGADPRQAEQAVRAAIDGLDLPPGTQVHVERVLPTSVPVITFNVAGAVDVRALRDAAERVLRPALVRVPGVGGVEVQGGRVREIEVILRPADLAAHQLTPSIVAERLAAQDLLIGVGRVVDEHQTLPVVVDAQPVDLAAIAALPVAPGPTGPLPLSAVADVVEGSTDPDVIVTGPAGDTVVVTVARLPGASTPAVVAGARRAVAALVTSGALPAAIEVEPVYDQAALVDESIASVRDAILIGVALALVVIGLFLRDLRAGLVAAVPVPLSLLATFATMRAAGFSLNLMSLGGLAVAIGLVVDDAIVVTEGIVRRLEDGSTRAAAARDGLGDLFAAVVGTTLTTVVVFAPLALLSGVTGSFLGALAGTLAAAVLWSLIYAVTITPLLARVVLRARPAAAPRRRLTRAIAGVVRWTVGHAVVAVAATLAIVVVGALALRAVKTGFLPPMDEGAFVLDFFTPPGTSLEETDRVARRIDRILASTPEVVTFTRRTGAEMGPATATQQNTGDVMVRLVAPDRRGAIDDVIDRVRARIAAEVPEVRSVRQVPRTCSRIGRQPGADRDPPARRRSAPAGRGRGRGRAELAALPELVDFFDGREGDVPIVRLAVDRLRTAALGLDVAALADDLTIASTGRVVAQLPAPSRPLDVRVRFADRTRLSADAMLAAPMAWAPRGVAVGAVVDATRPPAPSELRREGLRPAVVMTAAVADGDLGAAERAVARTLAAAGLPRGVQVEVGGQAASAAAAQRELLRIALIGAVLVLIVLVIQLRSLRLSLVVLTGAPLAVVGALATLWATGIALDVSSLAGCILLVGLVVKNGILLLEHAQQELQAGVALADALVAAVERRLRPVVMTTLATLAGLLPLAAGVGAGASLQRPLAVAVIGGLLVSPAIAGLAALTRVGPRALDA